MTKFKWSKRSLYELENVHPDLRAVCDLALQLSPIDFVITDGGRTLAEQKKYVASGASQTLNSNHLIQKDGYAYAIDYAPYFKGSAQPKAPLQQYKIIADAFKAAAKQLKIKIVWGGDWKSFVDGCHIELDRKFYPR